MKKNVRIPAKTKPPSVPPLTELSAKAEALVARNEHAEAIRLYRDWLGKSAQSPLAWAAQFNLGVLLKTVGDIGGATAAYRASLALNPRQVHARLNLGMVLDLQGRFDEALQEWKATLEYMDADPKADIELKCKTLNNLGWRLEQLKRYAEAEDMLTRSLRADPGQAATLYHRIYLRMRQCSWPIYDPLPGITLEDQMHATSAIATLSLTDDPAAQRSAAEKQVHGLIPPDLPKLAPAQGYAHDRLRIGYLSSNLNLHAVSILTAELYELHDRNRVEVWGFCWSPEDESGMHERVVAAMDHFVRIKDMSDEEAAKAIRAAEIDVLIDLQGLTRGCRPKILAQRPAPVQIGYLGFPATSALPEVDYVLADRYVIPEEFAHFYTEKPLYMPDCFQVNDRKRTATAPRERAAYGLPDDAFVFCAFNNNTKFTPEYFSAWMHILECVPHSVLWLLADNDRARSNLEKLAAEHGVAKERLVFAPRLSAADNLARFAVADLFLDLFPFNGGTTVSDALWMGLPVVTCSGRSFASRMGGSLLHAIGLPELVTHSIEEYTALAVALASDRSRVKSLRERILHNKETSSLFDTPRFVRNLEDILIALTGKRTRGADGEAPHGKRAHMVGEVPVIADLTAFPALPASTKLAILLPTVRWDAMAKGVIGAALGMANEEVAVLIADNSENEEKRAFLRDISRANPFVSAVSHQRNVGGKHNSLYLYEWCRDIEYVALMGDDDWVSPTYFYDGYCALKTHADATCAEVGSTLVDFGNGKLLNVTQPPMRGGILERMQRWNGTVARVTMYNTSRRPALSAALQYLRETPMPGFSMGEDLWELNRLALGDFITSPGPGCLLHYPENASMHGDSTLRMYNFFCKDIGLAYPAVHFLALSTAIQCAMFLSGSMSPIPTPEQRPICAQHVFAHLYSVFLPAVKAESSQAAAATVFAEHPDVLRGFMKYCTPPFTLAPRFDRELVDWFIQLIAVFESAPAADEQSLSMRFRDFADRVLA